MKLPPIHLADDAELEMWPHIPENSPMWDLQFAKDTQRILSAIESTDEYRQIHLIDNLRGWLYDLCEAYYCLATYTRVLPEQIALQYLAQLSAMEFRPSPMLNAPEHLDGSARLAFSTLVRKFRPLEQRYPRLLAAMQYVAILSPCEAKSGLAAYKRGDAYAGEAVNHFGGTKAVVERAWRFSRRTPLTPAKWCWKGGYRIHNRSYHRSFSHQHAV